MRSGTHLFPGVAETLRELKGRRLRLAICSNKPRALAVGLLAYFELTALIDLVLGPEDVPRPKPAPDVLLKAMSVLQLTTQEVLYVGDMVVDIETARAAGVTVWVVPTGSNDGPTLEQGRPDRILTAFRDLPGLLVDAFLDSPPVGPLP